MINIKTVEERNFFKPYGVELPPIDNTAGNTHQFTGQKRDTFTNYDYMHFRFYASNMGRFLKPDNIIPDITNPQNWNAYTYVKGNPVNFNDPSGHIRIVGQGIDEVEAILLYMEAKDYLSKSEVAKQVIEKMESLSGEKETTVVVNPKAPIDSYVEENNMIYWNPYLAVDVTDQGGEADAEGNFVQSPSLQLLHEAGHAVGSATGEKADDREGSDIQYDTKEERRVTEKIVNPAAKQLNEPTIKTHKATNYVKVESPTSKAEKTKIQGPTSKMIKKKIAKVDVPQENKKH